MKRFTVMSSKLLSLGMMGTMALAAVAIAVLFSSQTTTAQMMMQDQQMQNSSPQQHGMNHSMFSVMGMSMVPDVRVTGVTITGDSTVSVNLTYTGNGTSPGVTIVAMTNHMSMMNMMMGGGRNHGGYSDGMTMGQGMMINPNMMMNNSAFPSMMNPGMMGSGMMDGIHPDMMMMMAMAGSHTGSAVVDIGWQSGSSTSITLEGDRSARDASDICVMVFPHLT
jgi:hypothetical protein